MQNMSNSPNSFMARVSTPAEHAASSADRARRLLPLLTWVAALGGAIGLLLLMGRGELSTPSVLEPSAWPAWMAGRDPLEIAFAILRLVGLAAAWYLLGVTTIGVAARLLRWGRLVDAADILTVPSVRRLLQTALGLGLATAAVTGTTMGQVGAPDSRGPIVAVEDAGRREIVPVLATETTPGSPATSTQLPPGAAAQASVPVPPLTSSQAAPGVATPAPAPTPTHTPAPPVVPAQVTPPAVPAPTQPAGQQEDGTYVVRHGDHLWGIAEKTLEAAWGRAPADAQIIPYWQRLIETNRAALVDPGNPDLILPGQTFTVPPPPPPPAGS